jgi:hypothetical protein
MDGMVIRATVQQRSHAFEQRVFHIFKASLAEYAEILIRADEWLLE